MLLALLCAAKVVAVLPIEVRAGALQPADAAALEEAIRAAARETLADFTVPDAAQSAAAPRDPPAALSFFDGEAVLLGRAARLEGAAVVALGVYRPGSTGPAGIARIVGIGIDQLKEDARAKVPRLLRNALGLAPPKNEPPQQPGTLRIPAAQPKPEAPPPAEPAPPADPLVALIREVTSDVESLRGLRRKSNLKIQILDDGLFSFALREKAQKELTPAVIAAERARWLAFSLAPASADPGKIVLAVLDEQVAGFYDPFGKQLIVRKNPPASAAAAGPDGLRLVLAHEIEHALQDQNFGFPDLATLPDDDTRLARLALYEGDAMAVMTAYGARRSKKSVKIAIANAAAALKALDTESLLRVSGHSPELLKAPAILREEMVLPYSGGFALVAEVFRRGGFALVDRMFANPPASSHQVLHPETYFAGEAPLALPPPAVPPGTRLVAKGRMGEVGTRLVLETCVDKAVIKEFAARWAGDAYTIVEGPGRALSLLWVSAWSGDSAKNVANLARMQSPCWESPQPEGGGHLRFLGKEKRKLADASAEERSWRVEGSGAVLRIEVGSFCDGKAALALVRIESSDAATVALERFASSIKSSGSAPACAELE
jgi:hypothetical protein